jgi:hypothetical protein
MALFGGGGTDLNTLIAKKNYGKAIEVIKGQLAQRKSDPRLRMQLADVLTLAGGGKEAVSVLLPLADEYAREGFAAKAIAVLKKIEKIDPGRRDVEKSLATLIKSNRPAERPPAPPTPSLEIGIEEISLGMESVSAPAAPAAPDFEHDFPVPDEPEEGGITPPGAQMSAEDFRVGVLDVLGEALQASSSSKAAEEEQAAEAAAQTAAPAPARVASPLFEEFTQDELVEVIHGLQLESFAPGDIIITEGENGSSLFVLTSGVAKAFVRNQSGKHVFVRELREGDFFGEISLLSGKPRSATITAGTSCELLELDRVTLDSIAQTKPRVWEVLRDFASLRAGSARDRSAGSRSRPAP